MAGAMRGLSRDNLIVQNIAYDTKSTLDEENFYAQGHAKGPYELSKQITYLLGSEQYPITMMAYADIAGKGTAKEIDEIEYTYPVMERDYKTSAVAQTPANTNSLGKGSTTFEVKFEDNWFKRYYLLESERGIQARVMKDAEKQSDGTWLYTLQLNAVSPEASIPLSEITAGARWIDLAAIVPFEYNDGTESKMVAPGKVKNQITCIRKSMSWAGMSADRVMKYEMKTEGGSRINGWMDFFMYQFEKQWMEECESMYWYSRYNRLNNGEVSMKDILNGKPIPTGSGILEQIPNYDTYTQLTYAKLENLVSNALFNLRDAENQEIILYTGTGGRREINRALMEQGLQLLGSFGGGNIADKFVKGEGRNLMLTGFFDSFMTIDGYTIKVKYNPLFDGGRIAMKSPIHPETGFPLESYRMVFLDTSTYEGQSNLTHLTHKNKSYGEGYMAGLLTIPAALKVSWKLNGAGSLQQLSSAKDEGSYHRVKSMGVQIMRANKCFHVECVAGL